MSNRYKILVTVFLATFVFGMVLQSIPPVLTTIIEDLKFSHTQGGLLISLFALPGIIFSIPGGMLADRYGPKKVGMVSLLLMLVGTIVVASGSTFTVLAAGRFIAGVGGTSIVIIAAQSISYAFINDKHLGTAMGIFNAAVPSGTIFAHIVFSRLVTQWDWHITVLISALACLAVLLLFWIYTGLEAPFISEQGAKANGGRTAEKIDFLESFKNMRSYWSIWLVAVSWMLYIAAKMALFTFAPDYFLTIGYGYAIAGLLTSVFAMGSLVISPLAGHIIGKTGNAEKYLIAVGIAMAALIMLLVTASGGHLLIAIVIGLVAALFPVSIFCLAPTLLPAEKLGQGYGILRICENTGILVGPFVVGLAYDLSGAYLHGFLLMTIFFLGASASAMVLLRSRKKKSAQTETTADNPSEI